MGPMGWPAAHAAYAQDPPPAARSLTLALSWAASGSGTVSQDDLRELLARVHRKLEGAPALDPQSRELLVTVMHDIEKRLDGQSRPGEEAHPATRLEELAGRFDAEHHELSQTLRNLMDLLVKGGI